MHVLEQVQEIDASPEAVFAFFSDPGNLARITPSWLRFRIHGAPPSALGEGSRIEYRIRWLIFSAPLGHAHHALARAGRVPGRPGEGPVCRLGPHAPLRAAGRPGPDGGSRRVRAPLRPPRPAGPSPRRAPAARGNLFLPPPSDRGDLRARRPGSVPGRDFRRAAAALSTLIHWFRRDLRVADNTALWNAVRDGDRVVPVFVLDDHYGNDPDVGPARFRFLRESLESLAASLARLSGRLDPAPRPGRPGPARPPARDRRLRRLRQRRDRSVPRAARRRRRRGDRSGGRAPPTLPRRASRRARRHRIRRRRPVHRVHAVRAQVGGGREAGPLALARIARHTGARGRAPHQGARLARPAVGRARAEGRRARSLGPRPALLLGSGLPLWR